MNSNYRGQMPNPNYQHQQQQPQWSQSQNQNQQFGPGGPNPNQFYNQNPNHNSMRQPRPPQQNFPGPGTGPRPQQLLSQVPAVPDPPGPEQNSSFPPLLPPPMPPQFPWQIDIPVLGDDPQTQPYIKVGENWELSVKTGKPEVQKLNLLLYEDIIDQSLPKELRIMFQGLFCKLCSLTLSSPKVAREHYSGKRHMKCINEWLEKNKTTIDQNIQGYIRLAADKSTPNTQQQQQQPKVLPPPPPPPPSVPRPQQQQQMGNNYNQNLQQQQGPRPFPGPGGVNQQQQQMGNNFNQNLQQQQGPRPFTGVVNQQQQGPRPLSGGVNQQQGPRPFSGGPNQQQQFPGPQGPGEQSQRFQNPNFYNQQQPQQNFNMYQNQQRQQQPQQNFNNPNFNNFNNPNPKPPIPSLLSQPHIRPPDFEPQQQLNNPNSSFVDNRKRPFQAQVPSAYGKVEEVRNNSGDQVHRCEMCNVTVSTLPSLRDHLKGKNHLARLRQQGLPVPDKKDLVDLKNNFPRSRGPRPNKKERIARRIGRERNNMPAGGRSNANLEPLGAGGGFGNANLEPLGAGGGFGNNNANLGGGSGRFMNDIDEPPILIKRRK